MVHEKVKIQISGSSYEGILYTYFLENSPEIMPERRRPVVVICPGGGYEMTSDREAEAVAIQFLSMGYHAAVLRYSVAPARYPEALFQLADTVRYLREHAQQYYIDPEKIVVAGFSAGGHLAASLGVFWNKPFLAGKLDVDAQVLRPNGMILSYPVITSNEKRHKGSFVNLLGEKAEDPKMLDSLSLEKQVTADTPKTFLWHTASDQTVPVENSLLFFEALHRHQVPAELHIYPAGMHGLGLANEETRSADGRGVQKECQTWIDLAERWMKYSL